MSVSLESIKTLREKTASSLADCRSALEEAKGDADKAEELLRIRGKKIAEKKSDRAANASLIEAYVHSNGRVAVLVEMRCETDFVARNELFKQLAHDLALQIAAMNPRYGRVEEVPGELIDQERAKFQKEFSASCKPADVVKKIVDGKLAKFFEEQSLYTQPFVKDPAHIVKDIITDVFGKLRENIRLERFVRYEF